MSKTNFDKYNFAPFIMKAIEDIGFQEPTAIQKAIFPVAQKGNIIGQSQTGSGKTHSYLLPSLNTINPSRDEVQIVITAPTRELAKQIFDEIGKITKFCDEDKIITSRCFVGGTDKQRTIDKLKKQPHIIVGTPGRIHDLMTAEALQVHKATKMIIDEADLMLDMGFIHDVDKIAAKMSKHVQLLVFSATIPEKLKPFLKKYMEAPQHIHINPKQLAAVNLEHRLVPTRHRNKIDILKDVLVEVNPYLAIIFTNTKKNADDVADGLLARGLKVGRIHGDLSPRDRRKMMKQINALEYQYIVATDLASRGIDIEGITHVINYEFPDDLDFYVHRVGRTARAGQSGIAIAFYEERDYDAIARLDKRGIEFTHQELRKGEWVELGPLRKRETRKRKESEVDKTAKRLIQKPSKVKPGYKKKMQTKVDIFKEKQRRKNNQRTK